MVPGSSRPKAGTGESPLPGRVVPDAPCRAGRPGGFPPPSGRSGRDARSSPADRQRTDRVNLPSGVTGGFSPSRHRTGPSTVPLKTGGSVGPAPLLPRRALADTRPGNGTGFGAPARVTGGFRRRTMVRPSPRIKPPGAPRRAAFQLRTLIRFRGRPALASGRSSPSGGRAPGPHIESGVGVAVALLRQAGSPPGIALGTRRWPVAVATRSRQALLHTGNGPPTQRLITAIVFPLCNRLPRNVPGYGLRAPVRGWESRSRNGPNKIDLGSVRETIRNGCGDFTRGADFRPTGPSRPRVAPRRSKARHPGASTWGDQGFVSGPRPPHPRGSPRSRKNRAEWALV